MTVEPGRDYVLFDGDCGICSRSAELGKRMDEAGRFVIEPYQMFCETELQRFGLSYENCGDALQVITRQGRVHAGAFAVNYFLWQRWPGRLLVLLVYALPFLLLCEVVGYRLVANNRHRLSQWFGLNACLIKR